MEGCAAGADSGREDNVFIDWDSQSTRMICTAPDIGKLKREHSNWCPASFTMKRSLYKGKASLLYVATDHQTSDDVVLKLYRKNKLNKLNRYQVEREIRIHIRLKHEFIISLYAAFEDPKYVYMVLEYAQEGDLFGVMKKNGVYKERQAVREVLHPFLNVLLYLQSMDIIHRDIKPENIMVARDNTIRVADFGLSIDTTKERPVTRAGTLDYMAPEVLVCPDKKFPEQNKDNLSIAYSRQVDTWAVGILTYELIVGSPPFEKESRAATYDEIMYSEPKFPSMISEACKDFIRAALAKKSVVFVCQNSAERPGIVELMKHPWIALYQRCHSSRLLQPSRSSISLHPQPSGRGDLESMSNGAHGDSETKECVADPKPAAPKGFKIAVVTQEDPTESGQQRVPDEVSGEEDDCIRKIEGTAEADAAEKTRTCVKPPTGVLSKTVVPIPRAAEVCTSPVRGPILPLLSINSPRDSPQSLLEGGKHSPSEKDTRVRDCGAQASVSKADCKPRTEDLEDDIDSCSQTSPPGGKDATKGRLLGVFGFTKGCRKEGREDPEIPRVLSMTTLNFFSTSHNLNESNHPQESRAGDVESSGNPLEGGSGLDLDLEPSPPSWTTSLSPVNFRPAHRLNREMTGSQLSFTSIPSSEKTDKPVQSTLRTGVERPAQAGNGASDRLPDIRCSPSKRNLAPISSTAYERCNILSGNE